MDLLYYLAVTTELEAEIARLLYYGPLQGVLIGQIMLARLYVIVTVNHVSSREIPQPSSSQGPLLFVCCRSLSRAERMGVMKATLGLSG